MAFLGKSIQGVLDGFFIASGPSNPWLCEDLLLYLFWLSDRPLHSPGLPGLQPHRCFTSVLSNHLLTLLLFFFFFNWRIVALQYCVGCCHISTWISRRYTYVPSLFNFPPTSHSIPSFYVVTGPSFWVPWVMQKISPGWLSILHVVVYTFPCYSLHLSHCLIPPLHVHKSVLLVCVSTAALQIGSSLPSFQITYVCVNIRDLFFWLISLCIIGSGF